MGEEIDERCLLRWLEHYELGDWAGCGEIATARALDENGLLCSYQEAVAWTETGQECRSAGAADQFGANSRSEDQWSYGLRRALRPLSVSE